MSGVRTSAVKAEPSQLEKDEVEGTVVGSQAQSGSNCSKSAAGCGGSSAPSKSATVTKEQMDIVDNQFFFEDEIFRIDRKGRVRFGLVIETPDTYSDDDEEFDELLSKGEVRVAWYPEGREEVQLEKALALADRTLVPGDVVRRMVPGRETQRGYCRAINMKADVRIMGTKHVIPNVTAERLQLMSSWQRDSAVCLDSWVGSAKDIDSKAVLRSTYGCRIEISAKDYHVFKDMVTHASASIYNTQIIYPGNVVVGRLPSLDQVKLLTSNIPLHTNKKGKPLMEKFTIESVFTDTVWVHWQCKAMSYETNMGSDDLTEPSPCVTGEELKRLKRLNIFESCMLQISDRCYLKYSQCDKLITKSEWDRDQAERFKEVRGNRMMDNAQVRPVMHGPVGTSHHCPYHQVKKKLSLHDTDKTPKGKKFGLKAPYATTREKPSLGQGQDNATAAAATHTLSSEGSNYSTATITDAGWVTVEEDEIDKDDDDDDVVEDVMLWSELGSQHNEADCSTPSTVSTCSTPSPRSTPKYIARRQQQKKKSVAASWKKPSSSSGTSQEVVPKPGDELITEALLVYSTITVVWQDGSIEENIPSTELYPIHHLDNHEFFPGDFVSFIQEDLDLSFRDYGVIQSVDHHGRTARVKWFTTYTSMDEPRPTYKGEREMSVYDLKDHQDFQYRPGTMVIRVANFAGVDASCTAGQIIDNFTDGRIKVWWVDGHISMCWPQDLFEVGQYDHTEWGTESEDSWETASENSELDATIPNERSVAEWNILSNIERARVAIERLEEIFNISPKLQNPEVMRKLLNVYKGCRYLDRLLNTHFFHEDHFMGLIERVRKGGHQSLTERAIYRKNRLFNNTTPSTPNSKAHICSEQVIVSVNNTQNMSQTGAATAEGAASTTSAREYAPKVLFTISSTSLKCPHSAMKNSSTQTAASNWNTTKRKSSGVAAATAAGKDGSDATREDGAVTEDCKRNCSTLKCSTPNKSLTSSTRPEADSDAESDDEKSHISYNTEKNMLLNSVMKNIEKAYEKTGQLKGSTTPVPSQNDSGNYSRTENWNGDSPSNVSFSDLNNADRKNLELKASDDQKSMSCSSIVLVENATPELVCVRLCGLLREQLALCINEIREKYYKDEQVSFSDLVECDDEQPKTEVEDVTEIQPKTKINDTNVNSDMEMEVDEENDQEVASVLAKECAASAVTKMAMPVDSAQSAVLSPAPIAAANVPADCFQVLPHVPLTHKFHLTIFHPTNAQQYYRAVQREHRMLRSALPPGVWVKVFEDRMDLLSVMMEGPKNTPYEDGLFFFDIQLPRDYPRKPPLCHYISYCTDRLNPNLYEEGKVCVSLLGTWSGRESEVWSHNSTLLQVIVSIQGLILVPEPYFNEAGYEKQKGTQQGNENSRMYNEMVIIKVVQATTKLLQQMPGLFANEVAAHYNKRGLAMYERIRGWMELSKEQNPDVVLPYTPPEFSLVPASRGFCLTLAALLEPFKARVELVVTIP